MREDVKDLLHQAVGWYEPPPIGPEQLARRQKAQHRRARIAAAAVTMLVFVAAGTLTWSAFRPSRSIGPGGPEPATDVTASVHGVSITYARSWTLVDLWPLASSIASWPEPVGSSISIPQGTPERGGLPLLQLSNADFGLGSLCGTELTGEEAVLYVALNGGPYRVNADGSPIWFQQLSYDSGPCGKGWYAYKASNEPAGDGTALSTPYLVFAGFGPDVRQGDRDTVFDAFDSLKLAPFDDFRPPTEASPGYVVPGSADGLALPQVARVLCDENGTRVVSPSVSPQVDGVHVIIDNRLGFDSGFAVRFENGAGAGRNAPQGESRHVLDAPPGNIEIGCYGKGFAQPDFQSLEVVDDEGLYRSVELECASVVSETGDYAEGATGQQGNPVDLGRLLFDDAFELGSDDVVELGGYPQSEEPVVRLARDGRIVATVSYRRADGDGWLKETFSMCEELARPA